MPNSSPDSNTLRNAYLWVAGAAIGGGAFYAIFEPGPIVVDAEGFAVFAPLYIVAQAIERALEPVAARWNNTTAEKLTLKRARTKRKLLQSPPTGSQPGTTAQIEAVDTEIEAAELELARAKAKRAIPLWAWASVFGIALCALLGLGLIAAISKGLPESLGIRTLDVVLTGLAVGAGTKPLHDLIARLEKSKESADPATKADPAEP